MDPILLVVCVVAALMASVLSLGILASRVENAERLAELVRSTRRLRAQVAREAADRRSQRR